MTDWESRARLIEQILNQISAIETRTSQLAADMRRLASMPITEPADECPIAPPDYADYTSIAADLQSLKSSLDNGAAIAIEIGKVRPRASYWLVSADPDLNVAIIRASRIGSGMSEKILTITRAALIITGAYTLSKHGA